MRADGVSSQYPVVPCERLALVTFSYRGFDGATHDDGRLVVLDAVASSVRKIFQALLSRGFSIEQARPIEVYGGDDDRSIAANNTSAYNDRTVANSDRVSAHAYGVAIDVNPVQNPTISHVNGKEIIEPNAGAAFLKRRRLRPGMAEAAVEIFARYGFRVWGGRWREPLDYQHFQVESNLARRLTSLSPADAASIFENYVRAASKSGARF